MLQSEDSEMPKPLLMRENPSMMKVDLFRKNCHRDLNDLTAPSIVKMGLVPWGEE